MVSYELKIKKEAEKELRSLPKVDLKRVIQKIKSLGDNPRPQGAEKLKGEEGYRIRQGDWRVVYLIDDATKIVRVIRIGHRREVYR